MKKMNHILSKKSAIYAKNDLLLMMELYSIELETIAIIQENIKELHIKHATLSIKY